MNHKYQYPGLTLVEMIVSIAMIAIITSVFATNYHSTNKRTDLIMTAQSLVSDIHWAQNNTLGLVKYGTAVPPGGWGVHFDLDQPNEYIVFADLNAPGTAGYLEYDENTEGLVSSGARRVSLSDKINLSALAIAGTGELDANWVNITFLPPDPITNINSNLGTSTALEIELTEVQSNSKKVIQVNFLGLAEVAD